ncbi:MAG: hypothetical protein ACX931_05050 [Saccharospirillum sp.]
MQTEGEGARANVFGGANGRRFQVTDKESSDLSGLKLILTNGVGDV